MLCRKCGHCVTKTNTCVHVAVWSWIGRLGRRRGHWLAKAHIGVQISWLVEDWCVGPQAWARTYNVPHTCFYSTGVWIWRGDGTCVALTCKSRRHLVMVVWCSWGHWLEKFNFEVSLCVSFENPQVAAHCTVTFFGPWHVFSITFSRNPDRVPSLLPQRERKRERERNHTEIERRREIEEERTREWDWCVPSGTAPTGKRSTYLKTTGLFLERPLREPLQRRERGHRDGQGSSGSLAKLLDEGRHRERGNRHVHRSCPKNKQTPPKNET